ncbi:hypothetical protein GCM10009424_21550 [Sphingomonas ursincola]|uniref:Uncharacterized protein n=1 Tax=Sphingomonas ursincola TaxID=56361 RepID=A0A7V8RGU9_9SPHN|nr:hypothetical protein [Sphingomonas ursincola]MBA1376211.1 hypothetical protein [Sphingomonas ursincola]
MTRFLRWAKGKASVILKVPQINYALRGVPMPTMSHEQTQISIAAAIDTGGQLIARVGSNEGDAISQFMLMRRGRSNPKPYTDHIKETMKSGAGFFPTDDENLDRFAELYIKCIGQIDIYAAWSKFDKNIYKNDAEICRLIDLDPFFTINRWPLAMAGKRVTVVHPFTSTIARQFPKRDLLFDRPTLPDCTLTLVRAPQTQADASTDGQDWFANLAEMERQISDSQPDVCIVGAGAYGLPLAAHAKSLGATALMLGGATQLLFGIIGNRWLNDPQYKALVNEHWTRPGEDEKPEGFQKMEIAGGAYW